MELGLCNCDSEDMSEAGEKASSGVSEVNEEDRPLPIEERTLAAVVFFEEKLVSTTGL